MTPEISSMYACACDKKMKGVPQRCPNTDPFPSYVGFIVGPEGSVYRFRV